MDLNTIAPPETPSIEIKISSLLEWARESSVAKRVNFDATVLIGIAGNTNGGKGSMTTRQQNCIVNLYDRWNVAGWKRSRDRKAAGLPPLKRRRKR